MVDMQVHQKSASTFNEIEKLVQQLYQQNSPQQISQIQNILQTSQRSELGWQLADALLESQDENVRFFGALTFTVKINNDWCVRYYLHQYHDRVQCNLDDVVPLMRTAIMLPKPESDTRLIEESIKCFQSWVVYAHGAWTGKACQYTLRQLIPYIARPLWDHDIFEVAADCWTELMGTFPAFFTPESMVQLVEFLTSQNAQNLLSLIVKGEYEPEAVAYSRLLLAYGDVSLQDLAREQDSPPVQVLMRSLMQLLAFEGYAGAEDDICTPAMEFWQAYTEFLIDECHAKDDQVEPWMDSARRYVMQVVEQCWVKIRMPSEEVYAQWTSDAKGDFKVFRTDVVDLLQSAYTLLNAIIFDRFAHLTLESLRNQAWLHLEASLFCLNALAESISDDDTVDATLSTLFGSGLFAAMINDTLDIPSKTQQTALSLIISFTSFFERHIQFLPSMLSFLFVSIRTPALAGVAAKAVQSTCDSCRNSLVSEIDAFVEQYDDLLRCEDLESGTKERINGAIAAVIQALPSDQQKIASLGKLLAFVERDVMACLGFAETHVPVGAEEKGLCALRCLVSIGKYLQTPDDNPIDLESEPVTEDELYVATIWTPFQHRMVQSIYAVRGALGTNNGDVVEAICQVFRTGFRENFPGPFVFAPSVIETYVASTSLQTPRLENVLGTAGAMLSAHTRAGATRIDLSATRFLQHLFHITAAMDHNPANEPEVCSSCITLASKYVPHYLHIFLDPRYRDHFINFILLTIHSMQCQEIMPRRSAGFFWTSLFVRYDLKADVQELVDSILAQYGPQVTQAIINNIGGDAARSELENWTNPLRQMVSTEVRSRQWISEALSSRNFPSTKVDDAQKKLFLEQVMQ
ncbi:MAG: hypothetical protein Q9171_001727 [Xanthocarpia ochracea]